MTAIPAAPAKRPCRTWLKRIVTSKITIFTAAQIRTTELFELLMARPNAKTKKIAITAAAKSGFPSVESTLLYGLFQ